MDEWLQPYSESGTSRKYNPPPTQVHLASNFSGSSQTPASACFAYEPYKHPQSPSISPSAATNYHLREKGGDIPMHDNSDPYNRINCLARPYDQLHPSPARGPSNYISQDPSPAAQRFSPMDTSSSNSSFGPPHQIQNRQSSRQSPTRPGSYSSPIYCYSSRQQTRQIPSATPYSSKSETRNPSASVQLNAVLGNDGRSPRRHITQNSLSHSGRGCVLQFVKIRSAADLQPKINSQPAFRRADPEGGFISPLQALTSHLPSTYRICNPNFKYESSRNPRRVLTKPSKGVKNDGFDNEDCDYILYVNDILGSEETGHKNRYLILDVLGQGTFGQVVKCQNLKTQEVVAVKVVKNRTAYFNQSMMEVSVLDLLNTKLDKNDDHHLLRLKDTFIHRQHLCLVFELLSVNLYELIKQNQFRGLSTTLVRVFSQQLLKGLSLLNKARLIHCDLKPENILLKNLESPIIKIIDFGSACDERQTVYTYIQSRFYRSPEVLLGLPYSSAIDMWSLGCIVVELFLGLPLFPGSSEYNQVSRIVEMLGNPPSWMLDKGKQAGEFFEKRHAADGRRTYHLKSMEQYSREHGTKEQPSKKYFQATTLPEIIRSYAMPRKDMKQTEIDREMNNRIAFIDFVRGLLNINPLERWSPQQAKLHPFITQQKFTGPFVPPMNLKPSTVYRSPATTVHQQTQPQTQPVSHPPSQPQTLPQPHSQSQPHTQLQQSQSQHQQQTDSFNKQRAHAMQAQLQVQAHTQQSQIVAQPSYPSGISINQFSHSNQSQPAPAAFNSNMFSQGSSHQAAPPPYPQQSYTQLAIMPQLSSQNQPSHYNNGTSQQSLYVQAAVRSGRRRASTMEFQQGGVPVAIQRVASHLDPNHPIRLQPSPAYYPPPPDGPADTIYGNVRKGNNRLAQTNQDGSRSNRDFIQNLEDRTLEEGFMFQSQWH